MELLITVDQRYEQTPDGAVWTRMPPAADFFQSHLDIFSRVNVLARVRDVATPPRNSIRVDAPGVRLAPVPDYQGGEQFWESLTRIRAVVRTALARHPAVLLRTPSQLANAVWWLNGRRAHGVEVLADPRTLYRPGAIGKRGSFAVRWWFDAHVRGQCASAGAAVAVSETLRQHYCPRGDVLLDLELPEALEPPRPELRPATGGHLSIVSVGGFDYPVKGHDVLIAAVGELPPRDRERITLTIVGEGRLEGELRQQAADGRVRLVMPGAVGGAAAVRRYLEGADLFVLASRSEGQPRVVLEAMAAGVPVLATRVGGLAELLPAAQLVAPEDRLALSSRIAALLRSPAQRAAVALAGWERSREFVASRQRPRRRAFLEAVQSAAGAGQPVWSAAGGGAA